MKGIQIMVEEHVSIKRLLKVIRKMCKGLLAGSEVPYEDFEVIIDFIREYADTHHHGKEEKLLFNHMMTELGSVGEKLIRGGMLIEHDMGRLYVSDLEAALARCKEGDEESKLDIIANAISYTHLLERHIAKEDEVVYTFAERKLSEEILRQIDQDCEVFEAEAQSKGIQERYKNILIQLEQRYCI